jgi:nicotinate (nicotinamide) nucleotide adenylyltransferase
MKTLSVRVIMGGTFDPPHIGHDQMLQALVSEPGVSSVHVVPAFQNPLKSYSANPQEKMLGTEQDRMAWVQTWLEDFSQRFPSLKNKIILENLEIEKKSPSYTFETLQILKVKYPEASWVLALGDDQIKGFPNWHRVQELFSELKELWIFPRLFQESLAQIVQTIAPQLRDKTVFRVMGQKVHSVSSTQIRAWVREKNISLLESALLPPVIQKLLR